MIKQVLGRGRIIRMRDSALYQFALKHFDPVGLRRQQKEHAFFASLLGSHVTRPIFDIGANIGGKADIFSRLAPRVICLEPGAQTAAVLRERFRNRPNVLVIEKGVAATSGTEHFYMFDDNSGFNTCSQKWTEILQDPDRSRFGAVQTVRRQIQVPMTTLDQLIAEYGPPAFVKIDVEGYEVNVLQGLSQPVDLLSIECNLPEYQQETLECLDMLSEKLPNAIFNYSASEPPERLAWEQWRNHEEMASVITGGNERFLEIYCKPLTS